MADSKTKAEITAELDQVRGELDQVRGEFDKFKELAATDPGTGLPNEFLSRIEAAETARDEAIERANGLAIELGRCESRLEDCRKGFEKFRADSETLRVD